MKSIVCDTVYGYLNFKEIEDMEIWDIIEKFYPKTFELISETDIYEVKIKEEDMMTDDEIVSVIKEYQGEQAAHPLTMSARQKKASRPDSYKMKMIKEAMEELVADLDRCLTEMYLQNDDFDLELVRSALDYIERSRRNLEYYMG